MDLLSSATSSTNLIVSNFKIQESTYFDFKTLNEHFFEALRIILPNKYFLINNNREEIK